MKYQCMSACIINLVSGEPDAVQVILWASGGGLHEEGQPGDGRTLLQAFKAEMTRSFKKGGCCMKTSVLVLCAVFFLSTVALAGSVQYQVTGPVLEVRDDAIVVQKGNEKWEIARDKATSISGDLKVGAKVTVYDTMQASKVEVKEAPKTPAAPKKK
jgi:hypothetical protein